MTIKKDSKTVKKQKNEKKIRKNIEKKEKSGLHKVLNLQNNIKLTKEDRMLEKVERYVNKNREKTSQEIIEKKNKRPIKQYQEWDLEVMISRIWAESKPKDKTKETSKLIIYIIYTLIIIAILIFIMKFFFIWNIIPQNW